MLREVTPESGGALSARSARGAPVAAPRGHTAVCGSTGTIPPCAVPLGLRGSPRAVRCAVSGALGTRSSASCRVPLLGNSPATLRCPGEATLLKLSIVWLFADQAMGSGQLSAARISAPEVLRWSQTPVTVTRHPNRGWSYFCSCFLHCSIRRAWGNCPAPVVSAAVREKIKTFSAQEDLSLPLLKTEFI